MEHLDLSALPPALQLPVGLAVLALISLVVHLIAKHLIVRVVTKALEATPFAWDDILAERGVFDLIAFLAPLIVIHQGAGSVPGLGDGWVSALQKIVAVLSVFVIVRGIGRALDALDEIYLRADARNAHRPIKGYIQIVKLILSLLAVVLGIAILLERSPWFLLSGIGAATAVLLLVFQDTIRSFVASIQISSNDMLRIGDWIEMPKYGADGDVVDIALHTVRVQNWDKTITTVPTYKFIDDSYRNWRGMFDIGGRRIKRAVFLDVNSIRFLSEEEIERWRRHELLASYMDGKIAEIERWNRERSEEPVPEVRRLTNVGTFRAYVQAYLRAHPQIHDGLTLLVRQLAPDNRGLPMEIYCFTSDTRWAYYEGIQGDIFDHLYSILPEFGLRPFQDPTGADLNRALLPVEGPRG